jgi:hypothetical protein
VSDKKVMIRVWPLVPPMAPIGTETLSTGGFRTSWTLSPDRHGSQPLELHACFAARFGGVSGGKETHG